MSALRGMKRRPRRRGWGRERGRDRKRLGSGLNRLLVVFVLVLGCLVGPPRVVRGGDLPITAFSSSLDTPPAYVDSASLLFRFPQRAGTMSSQVFAFNLGSRSAVGAMGNTHGQGFFVLSQPEDLNSSSLFQAGWGGSWSFLRTGLAARATRRANEVTQLSTSDLQSSVRFEGAEFTLWEGSFGIGLGGESAAVDLALDVQRFDSKLSYLSLDYGVPEGDTTLVYLESDDDLSFGGAARIHVPAGAAELVGFGSWRRLDADYAGLEYEQSQLSNSTLVRELEGWTAGISASFPAGRLDELIATAQWRHDEDLNLNNAVRFQQQRTVDEGILAVALHQKLWRELWGQSGVLLAYTKQETDRDSFYGSPGSRYRTIETSEDFKQDFSWGVSYIWRNFDLRAAVRETFPISNLFFALDVYIRP